MLPLFLFNATQDAPSLRSHRGTNAHQYVSRRGVCPCLQFTDILAGNLSSRCHLFLRKICSKSSLFQFFSNHDCESYLWTRAESVKYTSHILFIRSLPAFWCPDADLGGTA